MKFAMCRNGPMTGPVVVDGERVVALSALLDDAPATLDNLVANRRIGEVRDPTGIDGVPLGAVQLGMPLVRVRNVVCIGRNYYEHVEEEGAEAMPEPPIFAKFSSSIVGPGDDVVWSLSTTVDVDWEAELAVVIGSPTVDVSVDKALDHVAAYTCVNDVSARDLQFDDVQWTRGKSLRTFCPMGPWLVTPDEVGDVTDLAVLCRVNGVVKQDSRTSQMIHGVAEVISFVSQHIGLDTGDVIATGTPGGVGYFANPRERLTDGDVVEVEVENIGILINHCRALA